MDIQKAIDIMATEKKCVERAEKSNCNRDCLNCDLILDSKDILKAYEVAISALEKQIPKKPVVKLDKYTGLFRSFYCPICGRFFGQAGIHNVILFNKERFCQSDGCGQAIDWSEYEARQ